MNLALPGTKRFLLIDDHTIIRSALKAQCIDYYPNSLVDESSDGKGIMEMLALNVYNLVIIDLQIPDCDTLRLIKTISTIHPAVSVLVYSMTAADIYALRVMKAGAKGFVSKEDSLEVLETAIGLALQGKRYICDEIADKLSDSAFTDTDTPFSKLSTRELQIASLLLSGRTITGISKLLQIGISTVGTHKGKIFHKLAVANLLEMKLIADIHKF